MADLRAGRSVIAARQKQDEADMAPVRYVSELLAWDDDPEKVVRRLIALIVACFDPLAISLVAAVSARRFR